jgi:hypothetical protein
MDTTASDYLTEDDLRNITPELLDEWFPAWRGVATDILRLGVEALAEQQTQPTGTTSAIPR